MFCYSSAQEEYCLAHGRLCWNVSSARCVLHVDVWLYFIVTKHGRYGQSCQYPEAVWCMSSAGCVVDVGMQVE